MNLGTTPPEDNRRARQDADTNAIYRPGHVESSNAFTRDPANDETALLTPVTDHTHALDRIPLTQRRRWQVALGSLGGIAALLLALTVYLWISSNSWQQRADELTVAAYDIGERLATEEEQVLAQQQQLDLLTQQLDTAQARLLALADEKAQERDSALDAQQEIDYLRELASIGGAVALTLTRCVEDHKTLVGYLKNIELYGAQEVADFEAAVNQICTAAINAATVYQEQLTG